MVAVEFFIGLREWRRVDLGARLLIDPMSYLRGSIGSEEGSGGKSTALCSGFWEDGMSKAFSKSSTTRFREFS